MPFDGQAHGASGRLDSWKEIAAYLGKGVRTVQRWEHSEGLPVRRLGQDRTGPVFAYKAEIDAWWQQQSSRLSPEAEVEIDATPRPVRKRWLALAAILVAGLGAVALVIQARRSADPNYRLVPLTTEHGSETQPSFSPDGRQIAYVAMSPGTEGLIHIKTIGADSSARLTSGILAERSPTWSPDGRLIAFRRRQLSPPTSSIMLVPSGGGLESRVADVTAVGMIVWSPDGRWLLTSEGGATERVIVAISVSSGAKHRLTEPDEFGHCGYGLSPDMRRLFYCARRPGASTIWEQSLDEELKPSGKPIALMKLWVRDMVVTPDAKEMIYTDGTMEEGVGLWRCRLTRGAKPELIHSTSDRYSWPAISQDQRRVALAVSRSFNEETWRLKLDGSAEAGPLLSTTHSDLNPDYSPDGRHIAFHSTRTGTSDIWTTDRDGKNPRRVTFTNARTTATPRWSPDGEWIAFESNLSGHSDVYVVRSNGGPYRRLTPNPATDAIPSWSRDGRMIYFTSDRTGRYEIWKIPAFGGQPMQVTRNGGFTAVESPDGKYLYYSETRNFGPVWRFALPDGKPEMVIPEVRGLFYAVTADGVYYQSNRALMFWDAATRQPRVVFEPARPMGYGMAVSPDRKDLLFTQVESQATDLYLIDGLR